MAWITLAIVILQALSPLAPILKEWIDSLLRRAAANLDADGKPSPDVYLAAEGVRLLLAEARKNLTFWQWLFGYGRALDKLESLLLSNCDAIYASARHGFSYQLTASELDELRSSF